MKKTKEPTAWWTVTGTQTDKTAVLMPHATEHDAQWHYGMMRTFGGGFSYIAITKKAATEARARKTLEDAGWKTKVLSGYEGWKETVKVGGAA